MAQTMIEKVLASHAADRQAQAGSIVVATPDVVLLNDVSGPVTIEQFAEMGGKQVRRPADIVLVADHFSPATDVKSAAAIQLLRRFGEEQGISHYYDTGNGGIEHAVIAERGFVRPGGLVFGADSHTCTAGALNACGIGFGSSDLAAAIALGELWVRVPEAIRIELVGALARCVSGKDVILHVLRAIGADGALGAALEFGGEGLASVGVDARMAVANMAVEAGAETCLIEADGKTAEYLAVCGAPAGTPVVADADADYRARHCIDLGALEPLVALPPSPANVVPVSEVSPTKVHQVYIGNCSNGTLTDLRQAAEVLRGRKVARGCVLSWCQPRSGFTGRQCRKGCSR